jgi:hypothetical protein
MIDGLHRIARERIVSKKYLDRNDHKQKNDPEKNCYREEEEEIKG